MTLHYNRSKEKWRRKELRNNMTKAEKILWDHLKNKKLDGYKFRRQYSVDSFIIDFYCPKVKLGIEVDGKVHFTYEAKEYDENRSGFLADFGIEIIRFKNDEIHYNIEMVLNKIKQKLKEREIKFLKAPLYRRDKIKKPLLNKEGFGEVR
ncbi:hypothetical protein BMS3Abin03_02130 [bacterium BMS3Abin03]|nr:hypothetical protein BMS3Abin03_02130 [bacterium BMS3Abin03]